MFKALLVITLCLMAIVLATTPDSPDTEGIVINLENGELCIISSQCKSSCCYRHSGVSLARCAPRSAERETCSKNSLYGSYYFCPCENGLTCEGDWSIGGSIININFGVCVDRNEPQ